MSYPDAVDYEILMAASDAEREGAVTAMMRELRAAGKPCDPPDAFAELYRRCAVALRETKRRR